MAVGVLVGLLSSAAAWIIFIVVSHPRLRWSKMLAERPASDGAGVVHQVKLLNMMPWSCVSVQIEAFLIVQGADPGRIIVRVPIREGSFPLIGGSVFSGFRRRKYGWIGSSHRLLTLYAKDIEELDLNRMRSADAAAVRRCRLGDLGYLIDGGAELMVTATAADGLFLGQFRRTVAVFRSRAALVSGTFAQGRSLEIVQPASIDRETVSGA